MATFKSKGFSYDHYIRPWKKKGKGRDEYLKWTSGLRSSWERITEAEYLNAKQRKP